MRDWLQVPLSYIIRYFFPGAVVFCYFYFLYPQCSATIWQQFGGLGIVLFGVLVGTFMYLVYRPLIYNPIIMWLQDIFRRSSDNYRTYLKKEFKEYNLRTRDAQFLYHQVKNAVIGTYSEEMQIVASCIHLLYISGIWSFAIAVWLMVKDDLNITMLSIFLISLILLVAGFYSDRYYETVELGFIKSINRNKLSSIAESLFSTRQTDQVARNNSNQSGNNTKINNA